MLTPFKADSTIVFKRLVMGKERTITEAEAKLKLSDLVSRLGGQMERYILTRNGKPEAVLMSYQDYDEMIESLLILANPEKVREIKESAEAMERGEYVSYNDVFGQPQPEK